MIKEYMFNDVDNMIELAREIQTKVYWGGSFYLDDDQFQWKHFWSIVEVERVTKDLVGVIIDSSNSIRFLHRRDTQ